MEPSAYSYRYLVSFLGKREYLSCTLHRQIQKFRLGSPIFLAPSTLGCNKAPASSIADIERTRHPTLGASRILESTVRSALTSFLIVHSHLAFTGRHLLVTPSFLIGSEFDEMVFRTRNCYYLRISERIVLPLYVRRIYFKTCRSQCLTKLGTLGVSV